MADWRNTMSHVLGYDKRIVLYNIPGYGIAAVVKRSDLTAPDSGLLNTLHENQLIAIIEDRDFDESLVVHRQ